MENHGNITKSQRIKVNTKGGLLAAFECAKAPLNPKATVRVEQNWYWSIPKYTILLPAGECAYLNTNIILERKTGITEFNLTYADKNIGKINKAKAAIRKIPAKDLLS